VKNCSDSLFWFLNGQFVGYDLTPPYDVTNPGLQRMPEGLIFFYNTVYVAQHQAALIQIGNGTVQAPSYNASLTPSLSPTLSMMIPTVTPSASASAGSGGGVQITFPSFANRSKVVEPDFVDSILIQVLPPCQSWDADQFEIEYSPSSSTNNRFARDVESFRSISFQYQIVNKDNVSFLSPLFRSHFTNSDC